MALMIVSSLIAIGGIGVAAFLYLKRPTIPDAMAARFPGVYRFLVNKGYIDEALRRLVVQPISRFRSMCCGSRCQGDRWRRQRDGADRR
jgi:NADH:ubiquinone oxidoreductase subunit 5 (subunit L)/multisubunit Na+/H+ antiporter MnhA subunit